MDVVIKFADGSLDAINVSYTDSPPEREYAGLLEFASKYPGRVRSLLRITRDLEGSNGDIRCIPLWKWLLTGQVGEGPVTFPALPPAAG